MYLALMLTIVLVIGFLVMGMIFITKRKEKKLNETQDVIKYYKTTDSRCLNCSYGYNIRNNHICVNKLLPKSDMCNSTYQERKEGSRILR